MGNTVDGKRPLQVRSSAAVEDMPTTVGGSQTPLQVGLAPAQVPVSTGSPTNLTGRDFPRDGATGAQAALTVGRWNRAGGLLVTASSVRAVLDSGDLSSIHPPIPRALWPVATSLAQALSLDGVLGKNSPLGARGAVGDDPMNPSFWMRLVGDWSGFAQMMTQYGGALSGLGSLGGKGPLTPEAIEALKVLGPIATQLAPGGLFTAVGPAGGLGAASSLGAAGLVGGHGFATNDRGDFVDEQGEVVRHTDVSYKGTERRVQLTELYTEADLEGRASTDAAFMVRGTLPEGDPSDEFDFTSKHAQFVTLTVVPETNDAYYLDLLDRDGNVIATSDLDDGVNYIQLQTQAGDELRARVRRGPSAENRMPHPAAMMIDAALAPLEIWAAGMRGWMGIEKPEPGYRLVVTPSTKEVSTTDVRGDHQIQAPL
ncbi:MAG: hypothetical protein RIT81_13020 [Deltaproteobacteria bacterium]